MTLLRLPTALGAAIACLVLAACSPADPRDQLDAALTTLRSDAAGPDKARACVEFRAAFEAYPGTAGDRDQLVSRAVPLLIRALGDPSSRSAAENALVSIGLPGYEALFAAATESAPAIQDGAVACLVRMSGTVVPVLLPALLGDDVAAQERAAAVLVRIGEPISATLRGYHQQFLAPFVDATASETAVLSTRGKSGLLAFARVFGAIGDPISIGTLLDGCEQLHRAYPDLGVAYLRVIQDLGPEAINKLPAGHRSNYERLRLIVGTR